MSSLTTLIQTPTPIDLPPTAYPIQENYPSPTPIGLPPTAYPTEMNYQSPTPVPPPQTIEAQATLVPELSYGSIEIIDDTTNRYINNPFGFSLVYPKTWQIKEDSHTLLLGTDAVSLYIGFMWTLESVDIFSRSGIPAGDIVSNGEVTILGATVNREELMYNNQIVAVLYGGAPSSIYAGDLLLSISFDVLDPNIDESALNDSITIADQIVESMEYVETSSLKPGEVPVVGWYGSIHFDPTFGDYMKLAPEGTGSFGIEGADEETEAQILALLDKEPPNKYAHFWGKLVCQVDDYNECTLTATKIRPDGPGPLFDPDIVDGWIGTISSTPDMAQYDDVFTAYGVYPIQYGIWSENSGIDEQIVELRDSGTPVRVWGQVFCGVMDANGCQIQVTLIKTTE
jgi:hypothetical protein